MLPNTRRNLAGQNGADNIKEQFSFIFFFLMFKDAKHEKKESFSSKTFSFPERVSWYSMGKWLVMGFRAQSESMVNNASGTN